MRKYYKIVALCLIAVFSLGMLSACGGRSYSKNDAGFTGQPHGIAKNVKDVEEKKVVNTVDIETTVDGDGGSTSTDTSVGEGTDEGTDEGADEGGDTNTDTDTDTDTDTGTDDGDTEISGENWTTSCMTFNVLEWDTHNTGYAQPDARAPWIVDQIKQYDPDLLGCQEVTKGSSGSNNWNMYQYIVDGLADKYDVNGLMDHKDQPGSKVAVNNYTIASGLLIFWKRDRFELKDSGAMVYSNDAGRHYQWVKLYDKKEDITILMTNTHMSINPGNDSAQGDAMRAQQGSELYQFWFKNCAEDMALYATGDYNHVTSSQAFANMTQGRFVSTREISQKSNANSGVDHVLINGDLQDCYEYHRCDETYEGGVAKVVEKREPQYCPSDHYAVIAYCSNAYR